MENSEHYEKCKSYIYDNPFYEMSGGDPTRQIAVHTCFEPCQKTGDCLLGFDFDEREPCTNELKNSGILCVDPSYTPCEIYVEEDQICFDDDNLVCIDWKKILYAVFITNIL